MGIYGPRNPYSKTGYYKVASHHKLKSRAKEQAERLRRIHPNVSYRVTRADAHSESKLEYGTGWIVWAGRKDGNYK